MTVCVVISLRPEILTWTLCGPGTLQLRHGSFDRHQGHTTTSTLTVGFCCLFDSLVSLMQLEVHVETVTCICRYFLCASGDRRHAILIIIVSR